MRKYSLPVRVSALVCALCLLLTGCGSAASPDEPGKSGVSAPAEEPVAESAAPAEEETTPDSEESELTDVETKAAQLAAE